jgi:redox-sensitive bicupin YhaK (pirin superfamily)
MEILSYVLEGALQHRDSMGTGSVIKPGDLQRMSAGTGVMHSEENASSAAPVHFLQIWIQPEKRNAEPGYEQKAFPVAERQGKLRLVASHDGRDGSVTVRQDVDLYSALLTPEARASLELRPGRHAWVQVARGNVELNGQPLVPGDGAALTGEKAVALVGKDYAEVLVFDLP